VAIPGGILKELLDRGIKALAQYGGHKRSEGSEINYVTRVKTPTLMLNGKHDVTFPYESTVKPMFDLLGTQKEEKKLRLYDTDHFIHRNEHIKESLDWLGRYLGPVK
jgi:dipeptidyl aminopeptidase/acylaminoacyl peptidase